MMNHASTTTATLQRAKALANCAQGWHRWHPTFTLGEKLCVVCGASAYCPQCQSRLLSQVHLILCALHRDEEQRRDQS